MASKFMNLKGLLLCLLLALPSPGAIAEASDPGSVNNSFDEDSLEALVNRVIPAPNSMMAQQTLDGDLVKALVQVTKSDGKTTPASPVAGMGFSSSVVYGVTDFIVARAKQEFALNFVAEFQKQLASATEKKLAALFPNTKKLLDLSREDVSKLFPIGNNLKVVLREDLEALPSSIVKNSTELGLESCRAALLNAAIVSYQQLRLGRPMKDALTVMETSLTQSDCGAIDRYKIVIEYLITTTAVYEFNRDVTVRLSRTESSRTEAILAAYSLFKLNNLDIERTKDRAFKMLDPSTYLSGETSGEFQQLVATISEIDALTKVSDSEKKPSSSPSPEDFKAYVDLLLRALHAAESAPVLKPCLDETRLLDSAVTDIWTIAEPLTTKDYPRAAIAAMSVVQSRKLFGGDKNALVAYKYLSFAGSMVAATSSEEAQKALEAAALPVGSYRMKKIHPLFALNAYAGASLNWEKVNPDNDRLDAFAPSPHVSLGVTWNHPGLVRYWGVYLQVLDLGTIASYRFLEEKDSLEVSQAPEIGFVQVVSPGLYFLMGLGRGAVLGLGASVSPELREIKDGQLVLRDEKAWRIGGFLAFDIPIFAF